MDNDEQRMIQQAIRNSKKEFKRVEHAALVIPECPTYYPTVEEFKDPFQYIGRYVSILNTLHLLLQIKFM